ncbi:hypothetical protein [Dysgonomonas sp. GY617]|uniref:hypothetical protein n=1 Tax=Dysgonomonas sp. GY617 TaxID=2780420 RepID=UPI0018840377|nr:hypothetical protein [Dysgonomonas sp. GY617]MBF0576143.1 hypothetical protein [Dysgonomonas sp. GY617]
MKYLVYILIITLVVSCSSPEKRTLDEQNSFCYWKTTFTFDSLDNNVWKQTTANHMYIRYFDVGWDNTSKKAKPISTVANKDSLPCKHITPAIFFSNNVFEQSTNQQLDTLVTRIKSRIEQTNEQFAIQDFANKYSEILIDCDWSKGTKDKFFYFIEKLKEAIPNKEITTTLRLWQYRNPTMAGIPPVKRVLLMCYNLQAANEYDIENSIITLNEIKKYVNEVSYPLKTDIALPLFSWGVIFRNKEFKGVIRNATCENYSNNKQYTSIEENRFRLNEEMIIGDFFARPGDEIRVEALSPKELQELTKYLLSEIKTDKYSRITFFTWDTNNIPTDEIKNIYTSSAR